MKISPSFILAAFSIALFPSCASITRGTTENFTVNSTPQAATVELSTGQSGETPATFKVPRKGTISGTISKSGYKTRNFSVPSSISGAGGTAMAGNIIFGGLIGAAVDAGSGAMHEHTPNPLNVTLEKE
tara:strand:+ start:805 stop:1191 length:387 start_codon:yes stop_codon:yes gene_type:complete